MSTDEDDFKAQVDALKARQERSDPGAKPAAASSARTPCRYGTKCWDTTGAHRAKFAHPADSPPKGEGAPKPAPKRPADTDDAPPPRPAAAGAGGGVVKQASLMGWINVKRRPEGGGGNGAESQEKEKKARAEAPLPRRPSRASSDVLITAVEDPEKTTVFPSEMEDVPQELELRMSAQHKFEGGGSRDWIDLSDRRPPPPMSIDAELPAGYVDAWDELHVRLPCSPRNTYRRKSNRDKDLSRWYLIQTSLADGIATSQDLHDAILSYHPKVAATWDFSGMHSFFNTIATKDESALFFASLLPRIVQLAFRLPHLCAAPIPLLTPGSARTVVLSQAQAASLLANAFLCTFPRQGPRGENSGEVGAEAAYQNVNMHTLWATPYGNQLPPSQAAKVRCLLHYFDRVTRNMPTGNVSFRRLQLGAAPDWANSRTLLSPITVHSAGLIEDEAGAIQIDFANKMIGGGVLGRGCIQEEIRFVINPELLVSLLFTAQMGDREAVAIVGAERFSNYQGYGRTFEFSGPHADKTPLDAQGRRQTEVIAVDALYYGASHRNRMAQWRDESVERELNKFYCGVQVYEPKAVPPAVATGNWGCGNFGGYHDLKALVQWMAASEAGRPLIYFTFGEPGLAQQLRELAALLVQHSVSVGTLRRLLASVSESLFKEGGEAEMAPMPQLFNILFDKYE